MCLFLLWLDGLKFANKAVGGAKPAVCLAACYDFARASKANAVDAACLDVPKRRRRVLHNHVDGALHCNLAVIVRLFEPPCKRLFEPPCKKVEKKCKKHLQHVYTCVFFHA